MSNIRFQEYLDILGWPYRPFARRIGVDEKQIRRWAKGERAPPARLLSWMERMARHVANNPPPNVQHKEKGRQLES